MKIKKISALVLSAACALCAGAACAAAVSLLDEANPMSGWGFGLGEEFPGAKGALSAAADAEAQRRPALRLAADFTGGGKYVQMGRALPSVDVEGISLWVKGPAGADGFTLRLIDGTGQCHQLPLRIDPAGAWQRVAFPVLKYFEKAGTSAALDFVGRYENWGGANDGKWHQPLKAVYVIVGSHVLGETKKGEFLFSGIKVATEPPKQEVVKAMRLDEALDDGEVDWGLNLGWEFKGAKGEMTCVEADGAKALRLASDFTGGGAYIAAEKNIGGLDLVALRMQVKTANATGFSCRYVDSSGQCHQAHGFKLKPDNAWQDVEIPVRGVVGGEHWGGKNDGRWHGPAKLFSFIIGPGNAADRKPTVLMRNITADVRQRVAVSGKPHEEKFGGRGRLDLSLSEDEMLAGRKVDWTGAPFAASEGPWNVSATVSSALHSPDNSFCVRLHVECLGASGSVLERFTLMDQCGSRGWRRVSNEFEFPSGTAKARFAARYYKTHGKVSFKEVVATPIEKTAGEKLVERILIDGRKTVDGRKQTNGHLFFPEETMDFEIGVQTLRPIPQDARKATVTVTDYWGAEALPPATIALGRNGREGGRIKYVGRFTVPKDAVAMGKYHELHVKVAAKGFADATEVSGFARLPKAESKKYPARDIPFQIRNWDSRIREYFELADRIGHRNIGLWGDSGWDFVEKLGNNWYTGGFAVEVERNGWKNTTKEKVYQKTYDLVSKHKNDKFWFICQGNEPNEKPERAKEKVEAYEQVYKAAHAAKPDITVVATSVPALDCFFKEGFGKWCDVYDYHVYETYENVRQGVRRYREMGKKYGCEKPVWCTELGLNSQGQTRYAVAQEVVKKITAFFAEGGASVSWFTIQYPDPEGKARGSGGDCHNTFDCQYNLFNPRLDAIMYYTMINNVTVKKVVDEVQHADGVQEFLFRDKTGDSFLVAWKEGERVDRGISLPTAKDIVLTRIDGSHERLVPANGVVTLGLSGEPVMLRYTDDATKLAKDHAPAALTVDPKQPLSILKGESRRVVIAGPGLRAADLAAKVPPRWSATFAQKGADVVMTVTAPKETDARTGRVMVQRFAKGSPCAEIALALPIMSPIGVTVAAAAGGVKATFVNNGAESKDVSWTIELVDAWTIRNGSYRLNEKGSLNAYLKGQNEGRARLAAGKTAVAQAQIADFTPQTIYRVRTTVVDDQGRKAVSERYVGGCARAVRATGKVTLDGKGGEPFWKNAPAERIGQSADESLRYVKDAPAWRGFKDLSATWKAAWDDANLYLLVEVTDDVYRAPISGSGLWNQDGLQFLFDPMRTSSEKAGKYDYGCGVTPAGPEAFCYLTAHSSVSEGRAPWKLAEQRLAGGSRRYEVAIPWTCLAPFKPGKGANLGLSMILNEDDGAGRVGFSGWFSGPHTKDLDHVGDLILD